MLQLSIYMKWVDKWHNPTNVVSPIELFTRLRTRFCAVRWLEEPQWHTHNTHSHHSDINVIGTFCLRSIFDKHAWICLESVPTCFMWFCVSTIDRTIQRIHKVRNSSKCRVPISIDIIYTYCTLYFVVLSTLLGLWDVLDRVFNYFSLANDRKYNWPRFSETRAHCFAIGKRSLILTTNVHELRRNHPDISRKPIILCT